VSTGPYILIRDDDDDWYVCPAEKREEARAYLEAVEHYWASDAAGEVGPPEEPEWLDQVGGPPSLVKFTGYTIDPR
jgi:hypothetical protein